MKKQDLRNGDIIVNRAGKLGVAIINNTDDYCNYILYQTEGMDFFFEFDDDLISVEEGSSEWDIMEVHRGCSFMEIVPDELLPEWQREPGWRSPAEEARKAREQRIAEAELEEEREKEAAGQAGKTAEEKGYLEIITQAFYGNRTATEILPEDVDRFILGYQDSRLEVTDPIDRTIISLPDSDHAVLVYNKYAEEERLADKEKWLKEEGYVMKPLAEIPEIGLSIFSRCIACGRKEDGTLESLHEEDYEIIMKYLAK